MLIPAALAHYRTTYLLARNATQSAARMCGVLLTNRQFAEACRAGRTELSPAEWARAAEQMADTLAAICSDELLPEVMYLRANAVCRIA